MDYGIEELVPLVAELAEKFAGFESTSIPYEKAEQLMAAVVYCIQEFHTYGKSNRLEGNPLSAKAAYQIGSQHVVEKVNEMKDMYNRLLPNFCSYGNHCLYDTFVKGILAFLKWYDVKYAPQNTILTLDYPVLKDISDATGIDAVYEFVNCIRLEQIFLSKFDSAYVEKVLGRYDADSKNMIENISRIVMENTIGHILAHKPLQEQGFTSSEYEAIASNYGVLNQKELEKELAALWKEFINKFYDHNEELAHYLSRDIPNIAFRLKNAVKFDGMEGLFVL